MLMKEIEDNTNRWKDILCSQIKSINIVKNDRTIQGNLQIQCNPYQITNGIFHRTITKKNFVKIYSETEKTSSSQNHLEKEEHSGGITVPDFRLYYINPVMKTYVLSQKPDTWIIGTG